MSNQLSPNLRVSETGKRFNRTIAIFVIHSYRRYPIASFMNSPMRNLPFIHGECPRKPEKTMFTRSSQLVDITFAAFACLGVFADSTLFFQGYKWRPSVDVSTDKVSPLRNGKMRWADSELELNLLVQKVCIYNIAFGYPCKNVPATSGISMLVKYTSPPRYD